MWFSFFKPNLRFSVAFKLKTEPHLTEYWFLCFLKRFRADLKRCLVRSVKAFSSSLYGQVWTSWQGHQILDRNIHSVAKIMWTPNYHTHMCFLNIPFQTWSLLLLLFYCTVYLHSSKKAFDCGDLSSFIHKSIREVWRSDKSGEEAWGAVGILAHPEGFQWCWGQGSVQDTRESFHSSVALLWSLIMEHRHAQRSLDPLVPVN